MGTGAARVFGRSLGLGPVLPISGFIWVHRAGRAPPGCGSPVECQFCARIESGDVVLAGKRCRPLALYRLRITLNLTTAGLPTLPAASMALIEILCFLPLPRFDFALTL